MGRLLKYSLNFLVTLLFFKSTTFAQAIRTDNSLTSIDENNIKNEQLVQIPEKGSNVDEILGSKDIFPFLPDNHRDSRNNIFNAFE